MFKALVVHSFTALGAVCGLFSLYAIYLGNYRLLFLLMATAIIIDGLDGTLARTLKIHTKHNPLDGALLDNIIDYLNYAVVPAFFVLVSPLLSQPFNFIASALIVLTSAYQFTQVNAKTDDHFFIGFPDYWNLVIFYFSIWAIKGNLAFLILVILNILIFVPIKYVYPSRLEYLSHSVHFRRLFTLLTLAWSLSFGISVWIYPSSNIFLSLISVVYFTIYLFTSLYCTFKQA